MGRVIVCCGKHGKKPFCFSGSSQKLYTTEEICYFLYHNPAMAEEHLKDPRLPDYYEKELALPETAGTLRILQEAEAPYKEYAQTIFASTPFLTGEEQKEYFEELSNLLDKKPWQRQKGKADSYLENREYRLAIRQYEKLLQERENNGISESAAGNILHNLAICELHILGPKSAGVHFAEAYEKNYSVDSLRSYLFCLRLSKKDTEYMDALSHYEVSEELRSEIDMTLVECSMDVTETVEYQSLLRVKKMLLEGQIADYRHATRVLISEFMDQYRKDAQ